jgi:hypothetical protein
MVNLLGFGGGLISSLPKTLFAIITSTVMADSAIEWMLLGGCPTRGRKSHSRLANHIQRVILDLPKWQEAGKLPNWHTLFLKNALDNTDLYSILRETRSGTTTMISKKVV